MSRYLRWSAPAFLALSSIAIVGPAAAQLNSGPVVPATAPEAPRTPPETYGAERPETGYGPPRPIEQCDRDQEASAISGEIVVCRKLGNQKEFRIRSEGRAQTEYARETMHKGDPQAPDVAGPGIFRGKATVAGCGLSPCPPAVMPDIDFAAIPEAPQGSDADRVGRGLAPRGNEGKPQDTAKGSFETTLVAANAAEPEG